MDTVVSGADDFTDAGGLTSVEPHQDRHAGVLRGAAGVVSGVVAGVLLVLSMQVGVAFGLGEDAREWDDVLEWGDHWMWRGVASLAATSAAAFIAGMIARRRGRLIGALSAIPGALYWALVAYVGWGGTFPGSIAVDSIALGYRIVAILLVVASVPTAAAIGREGAAYGRANAVHFDDRRGTLLGIKWIHFIWLPVLIHFMVVTAVFGSVYGFSWLTTAWKSGMSLLALLPTVFLIAIYTVLQWLGNGALQTYLALAGFKDGSGLSTFRRVMKYGVGYTLATALALVVIGALHLGLSALLGRFGG
jgi:hypothetical protein